MKKGFNRLTQYFFAILFLVIPLGVNAQTPAGSSSADAARGAYWVEGLGHCGACHTPRGIGFEEKAYTAADPLFLSGAIIEGWLANNLRNSKLTQSEFVELLKYGVTQNKGVVGPMRDVITESTQYLLDEDLNHIAAYLVSLQKPQRVEKSSATPSKDVKAMEHYMEYCSTCHGVKGDGIAQAVPALAGNSNVNNTDARNMIHVLHDGAHTPTLHGRASYVMPAYKEILTQEELIGLINHIRQSWGNQAPAITSKEYQEVIKK